MGPELESEGKSRTPMDIPTGEQGTASKDLNKMICAKNCQDNSFLTENLAVEHTLNRSEGPDINVIDEIDTSEKGNYETESEDATDNSSSFGNTDSGISNGPRSELHDDASSSFPFDGFGDLFRTRKRKLTSDWKKFAQPLLWRCKWLELQIRALEALGLKYEKELAEYDRIKQRDLLNFMSEDHSVKCAPVSLQNKKRLIMKRKKRKMVEDETDIASYMSNHKIFSALGMSPLWSTFVIGKALLLFFNQRERIVFNEGCFAVNRKSFAGRPYMEDDFFNSAKPAKYNYISDEFEEGGGWACLDFKDDNKLEEYLKKIDDSQLQLRLLKARLDALPCPTIDAPIPINALPSCSSPNHMAHVNGDCPETSLCTTFQHTSAADGEDVFMPDLAASSHGDITPLLDMVESSDQPQIAVPFLKIKDEVLISDQFVEEEVGSERIGKPKVRNGVEAISDVNPAQQAAKVRQGSKTGSPKNKRKRPLRRKSRINKYSRRSFG